jgi:hypothetical protein
LGRKGKREERGKRAGEELEEHRVGEAYLAVVFAKPKEARSGPAT